MTNAAPTVAVGQVFEQLLVEDLTRTRIVQYAGASGDFNPLHTDATYATEVAGFPGVFAHGMLTMGMTGRVVTDVFGIAALRRFGGRFVAQVWPGDTLTARAAVVAVEDGQARLAVTTTNQDGAVVFSGEAVVALPPQPRRRP
ncbi:MaoC/PaaZ C-terminal domain-containing protein [Nocardioides sp. LHD-245]|uniref:MaoC family dehydratase n=1 Tax=Nocardioides sp. LHD-245 TaxID=3051387 RepID=UPI0027E0CD24|nr:MaoC/PaaZ C-terminal domain-containing protein [Nocardioides sp. LHD-245]